MIKDKEIIPPHVIVFVEGDTDELLFKALIEHYKSISKTELKPCSVCNLRGVTRYTSKLLAKLQNEYIPEARKNGYNIQTICCSYDTDVFEERNPLAINWESLRKDVKRLGIKGFLRIGVCSSIEDWILDDIEGICRYLRIKPQHKSPKGANGNTKLNSLYNLARRTYQKGYATKDLISAINLDIIRRKRADVLYPLEKVLGVIER